MDVEQPRGMQGSLHSQSDQSLSLCVFFCVGVQRFAQARSRGLGGCMDETEGLGGVQFEYRVVAVCVSSEGNTHVRVKRVCRKQCGM